MRSARWLIARAASNHLEAVAHCRTSADQHAHAAWPCMLADAAGVVAKKQPVLKPCRLCPARDKKRSYYGHWDEETMTWAFYCCTSCFQNLKDNGEDVSNLITSNEAAKHKNGATPPPTFPPNTTRCRGHQQDQLQGAPAMPSAVLRFT